MNLYGKPQEIMHIIAGTNPGAVEALRSVRVNVPTLKREIAAYQGAALYALVRPYNFEGAAILELGTAWGYSAAIMATAAPLARITTLNPKDTEVPYARKHLAPYPRVEVKQRISWEYLEEHRAGVGELFDVIFVDGDHKRVRLDLPWWEFVAPGGLMLFHDYSPAGSGRECPPVYEALNAWRVELGRPEFDVLIVDDQQVGMAGFYRPK